MPTATLTADQSEVLAALTQVQDRLNSHEADLAWRAKLVERGRELGLTQAFIADHIDVKPSVLGQAALRDRRRAS